MNSYKNNDNRYFRLASFYGAVFLFAKGLELVNVDRTNPSRSQFVFIDTPERESLLQTFNFSKENSPEVLIDARKFATAIKTLKQALYQEKL